MALNWGHVAALVAENTFSHVRVETNLFPPITIDTAALVDGPPSIWPRLLQPRVVIDGPGGPIELAPYGTPPLSSFMGVGVGTLVLIGVLVGVFALGRASV